jgi:lactate dehydrogenase-like 2-hydroxyacid dehydrogenase
LGLHERPLISRLNSFIEPYELKAGMVFAVETFCPAKDGVSAARIEEEVVLTPDGAKGHFALIPHRSCRLPTNTESLSIGWIGTGRMGYEMAARLAKGGADVLAWNRTRAKAEPLAGLRREDRGQSCRARVARHRLLHGVDVG